jgi:DNA (cytosine-5)-methyltransferase 1
MYRQHTYTRVSEQRGTKRLWLQGLRLAACGFERGARYRVDFDLDRGRLDLVLDPAGNRVVSGRRTARDGHEPIVDLCNADVVRLVGTAVHVRADFAHGRITFSVSHVERAIRAREQRLRRELADGCVSEGTLCAGIGMATAALHEGLARGGVRGQVRWIVDRERRYLQAADDNNAVVEASTTLFEASLEELEPELLDPVSILQVSLPCTGHSPAGKAKNRIEHAEAHATDATAMLGFMRVVEAIQPSVIVSENVIPARSSATFLLIRARLQQLGYVIHEIELGPEQSGAFECRRRWWFVAVSRGLDRLDLRTIRAFPRRYASLGALLDPVDDASPAWSDNGYLKDKQRRDAAAGKGFAARQLVTAEAPSIGTAGRAYQKRRSTEPFLTRADGRERLLTPAELARAHGAPESLIAGIVDAVAYEGLGQGIDWYQAVGIGEVIARSLTRAGDTSDGREGTCETVRARAADHDREQLGLFG